MALEIPKINLTDSVLPITTVIALVGILLKGWFLIQIEVNLLHDVDKRLEAIEHPSNRWTCYDHQQFRYELAIANPKLLIPPMPKNCTN